MKRVDLPLMLVCSLMVLWLASCSDKASTSSGGGIPDKLHYATLLIEPHYDISSLSYIVVDRDTPLMSIQRNGLIKVSDTFLSAASIEEIACTIIHELWHFNNYDAPTETREINARSAGRECVQRLT